MKPLILLILTLLSATSYSQTFQAYYQQNFHWEGSKFKQDDSALTSTKFAFDQKKLTIDKSSFVITNRISNSTGDYITATSNEDKTISISIVMEVKTDANGRKFKCLTVERPKHYRIVYYLN